MTYITNLNQLNQRSVAAAGGKAASLGELLHAGIQIPPGFVITADAFDDFLKEHDLGAEIEQLLRDVDVNDYKTVETVSVAIRGKIEQLPFPEDLAQDIYGAFTSLNAPFVAVRSSATAEDGAHDAWAGQLETYLNTTKENLIAHVQKCWSSLFTPRAIVYRFEKAMDEKHIAVAVIVQAMIQSEIAGVAFSVHPVTEDTGVIVIEAGIGLGEAVVSGQITPDTYVVSKDSQEIAERHISHQKKMLQKNASGVTNWVSIDKESQKFADDQIVVLAKHIVHIERHYGFPVDVEWAFFDGQFFFTQSRPITTLQKEGAGNDAYLAELLKTQISMSEWFEEVGHPQAAALRDEDNTKRDRLDVLLDTIGLPYAKPTRFMAADVAERTPAFKDFFDAHADDLCALRLVPIDPSLPKFRMRGKSVKEVTQAWFPEQDIDPKAYKANYIPHPSDNLWSTIFVVNQDGIFGEIIRGGHHQLTQGFHTEGVPIAFSYDFSEWKLSEENAEARAHLPDIMQYLRVEDDAKKTALRDTLDSTFAQEYLCGYFETVTSTDHGVWFGDYNRVLGDAFTFSHVKTNVADGALLHGHIGSPGVAAGTVRIVAPEDIQTVQLTSTDILVCEMTSPAYAPLMKQVAAIVTDQGGILSHAAIVSRELNKPCVVNTKYATARLTEGQHITVDAVNGTITLSK